MVHSAKEKSVARIPEALDGDIMNKRPKRKIFKKKLEYNEGLHWQEERDLCRALYASLNPHQTKDRCGFDLSENGDSEVTDSGEMASCLEEDSLESSTFQQSSSASDVNESESTDQEKKDAMSFNHAVPHTLRQELKRYKERRKKKHKHTKVREKRTPSLKLAFFEDDELKNKKIHAQRKFAVSYSPSASPNKPTPLSSPILKAKLGKLSPTCGSDPDSIFNCSPKTEDFLTFLCLRDTSVLPGSMNFAKKSYQRSLKLQMKESVAESEETRTKNSHALKQAKPLRKKDRSLLQKEKAKAVRTLNHKKRIRERPWRECKQPIKIGNDLKIPKELSTSEILVGPLTPPCLSPIPPPIVTVAEHHNPPPLIPIMPLDGSKKGHKERLNREHKNGPVDLPKLRKRRKVALRTTSYQSAKSTNAAIESHQVLLKRKLRSNAEAESTVTKKRKVKVELIKREVNDMLNRGNSNHLQSTLGKKGKKPGRLNGSLAHGPVTRANVSSKVSQGITVTLNGKRRGRKKKLHRLKESEAKESKKEIVKAEKKEKKDISSVTPRRSTRKRILRFDVQCVYSGLLSSSNAIIQSTDCICPCCKIDDRKPRKRISKVKQKKPELRQLQESPVGADSPANVKVDRNGDNGTGKYSRTDSQRQPKQSANPKPPEEVWSNNITKMEESGGKEKQDKIPEGVGKSSANLNSNVGVVKTNLNGSFDGISIVKAIPDKRTLKPSRRQGKVMNLKKDDMYKNGQLIYKKLRNGTNLSLPPFSIVSSKFHPKDRVSPIKDTAPGSHVQPERKRVVPNKTSSSRKRPLQQPLRTKLERQFPCANKSSSPLSLKSKSRLSNSLVGGKSKCGIPITHPRLASNSLIRDIEPSANFSTSSNNNLTEVPTFHPTAQDWSNLMSYLEKNAKTIEKFGMCKIKPPPGHEPTGSFPDSLRFTPEVQYIHRLHHRWSSSSKRLACLKRHLEKKEKVAFQPPQIFGCEVDLLKFSELISMEGGFKAVRAKKKWPKMADQLNIPRSVSRRTNKLENIYLKYLVSFSTLSQAEKNVLMREVEVERQHRLEEASHTNPFVVTESEVRRTCHQTSLSQFKERADILEQIIRAGEDNTPCHVEREFWKIVEESDSYVAVQRAEIQGCVSERFSSNLSNLHENGSNILSVLPTATKQKLPTLKVGTVYSVEPWRASSHGLGKLEYLHSGSHKIWYSIPKCQTAQLENALQEYTTETKGKSCLYDKSFIFMLPPEMVQEKNLTVYRAVQQPEELIVQWYGAATSSVSCGFHISESFPLASSNWLEGARQAFEMSKALNQPSLFSLEQLLYLLIEDIRQGRKPCGDMVDKLLPIFKAFRNKEESLRNKLKHSGLNLIALADKTSCSPAKGSRSPGRSGPRTPDEELVQCVVCNHHCYFSMVTNEREDKVYCLEHASEIFNNGKVYNGWTVYYRIGQEKMTEVVKVLSQASPACKTSGTSDFMDHLTMAATTAVA